MSRLVIFFQSISNWGLGSILIVSLGTPLAMGGEDNPFLNELPTEDCKKPSAQHYKPKVIGRALEYAPKINKKIRRMSRLINRRVMNLLFRNLF